MISKEKVLAYIFREVNGLLEVLVFDHPGVSEVNPQVPSGTIDENEKPSFAVLREIEEESGLVFEAMDIHLGVFEHDASYKGETHQRHVFSLVTNGLPDSWTHQVKSLDEDNGEIFNYYWLPLEVAKASLVAEQGKYLPAANGHIINSSDIFTELYNEELKIAGTNANLSKYFGLKRVAAHYFKIPSGYRTSEPHAESMEEEFVFVISGQIDLWLNGKIKTMKKGDCIGFPSGTGVGHCFINNYEIPCELFVSGERTKSENQYHFHLDPSLKDVCGVKWWDDMPKQVLGTHLGLPGTVKSDEYDDSITTLNGYANLTDESYSYPGDSETFGNGVCLSRPFGLKNIAIWLERVPVGKRTSWPHAHSVEEEFVFVLEGEPTVLLDSNEFSAKPFDGIDFKAGSGIAHTLINKTSDFIFYLCVGECDPVGDKIYYPQHAARNKEMKDKGLLWEEKWHD
ncbi:cupin domain-containing protein [Bacteriovorax sp. Seq25_V]|uniref:cupin domain-containing protein n=1 Tax=Bacteriovorax sp. Seq25_V TaxID=1201288 RepID=UPI00038A2838|nr:cupin domain-containing protein [Bacteriovorax sp. Seq25_V]EQC43740.1 cupin domain protein [Bacteriovorax sp. Seq25_V]